MRSRHSFFRPNTIPIFFEGENYNVKIHYWNLSHELGSVGHISLSVEDKHLGLWPIPGFLGTVMATPFSPLPSPAHIETSLQVEKEREGREPSNTINLTVNKEQKDKLITQIDKMTKDVEDFNVLFTLHPNVSLSKIWLNASKGFHNLVEDPFSQTHPAEHTNFGTALADSVTNYANNISLLNCAGAVSKILIDSGVDIEHSNTPMGVVHEVEKVIERHRGPSFK